SIPGTSCGKSPTPKPGFARFTLLLIASSLLGQFNSFATTADTPPIDFPKSLSSYPSSEGQRLSTILFERARSEPLNLVATVLFILAIIHTFLAPKFQRWSHELEHAHQERLLRAGKALDSEVSFAAETFHFLGEIEAIFGIWVVPLMIAISASKGWNAARDYLGRGLDFTEPLFVVVIMTIAASRPVLRLSEAMLAFFARLGGESPGAWWFSILTLGPLLGSLITEPAAMTISALLLASRFYSFKPSPNFAYATLGLLFVNISVGGTLTHFAAPPVLMVAGRWGWNTPFMLSHFGWKAAGGIVLANLVYFAWFRREFAALAAQPREQASQPEQPTPGSIIVAHVFFLAWTVLNSHFPALFVGGFLFYLAFRQATEHHQDELGLRPALLVGFFLAGLVVHGGLQGWWIQPVLSGLNRTGLFFGAAGLTAFNDNAAITYLASLVPNSESAARYAVVAGAVAAGGLTVIANAPNPAGQSILAKFFPDGISAWRLFLGALVPTAILSCCFLLFR
ncbi:MAG TPA: putative Na+/H+ antiporter, partial [Candidatus Dormibacteraeota bacterium]|nr:putative Na+/H+ antiporter [Candidatus Dormibacteraeota bacterium]